MSVKTNLLILGGSGRTGIHVLTQAAARGHRVARWYATPTPSRLRSASS
ncbi:hypothetical protein [Streptomyces europaeiscabiei]|nr:hypothetical protein [Streptomyces europaeiscabiei]MDX3714304.1 hypothetical protein [Streptomyces europaeiscabiei]MDX3837970.1 hypothetical protein [Streptomyces europaeiscabiei]MDX3861771.1 hypothetical protein [Streptomyces europaeiscabiei]